MTYSVKFNDIELGEYIDVLQDFTPLLGSEWSPNILSLNGRKKGAYFQYTAYGEKTIPMPFTILGNLEQKYDNLQKILNVEEPKPLIFESLPNRVFYAVPSGDMDFIENGPLGEGTITWVIPDGVAHALTEKEVLNNGTATTITLTNEGTEAVPISVKATMKSDNGYLGLTLGDRFYQVGDPGEVDEVEKEKSEKLFDTHFTSADGWLLNQGITPPVTAERLQTGTVTYVTEDAGSDEGYVKVSDYKTGDSWHGAALTKIVPQDSQGEYPVNWRSEWRFDMNTDGGQNKGSQIGHNSVTFSDENDEIICAVVFEDNNPVYERSDMAVYIDGNRVWDTRETTSFYVTGRGGNGPVVIVEKLGNQITVSFSYGGIKKTFLSSKPDAQLRKVTWYCAAYKSYAPITNNNIRALNVTKHNVQYFEDIPNFLSEGDVVELDGPKNKLYINDIKDWDRVDIGSRPLLLPPGQHTLGIIVSEWAETPEVEVTYQERWL